MMTANKTAFSVNPIFSVAPIVLPAAGRLTDLQVRVTAPVTGSHLPIVLLSHGHGRSNFVSSLYGYAPLASQLAADGFVVLQPTHLDAKMLPFREADHPDAPLFWRSRAEDMTMILDNLDIIESAVVSLSGRLNRTKVGVVGHSMGGHTASLLLGARHKATGGDHETRVMDRRLGAGVILAGVGRGDALSKYASAHYPFFSTIDFSTMATPTLVVVGDKDHSPHLTTAGPAWHADPYFLSPGRKALLTLFGAEHGLGGVAGYDLAETTDEIPSAWRPLRSSARGICEARSTEKSPRGVTRARS